MQYNLHHRKAKFDDLRQIVTLLLEDELGSTRENLSEKLDQKYIDSFHLINQDPNQYLMVVEMDKEIIGTCHLNIMASLTFTGSIRMQIEAVRVSEKHRGKKIGEWMIKQAMEYAQTKNASIIQLTTNKKRPRAKQFYERLGFKASHEGMKLYIS